MRNDRAVVRYEEFEGGGVAAARSSDRRRAGQPRRRRGERLRRHEAAEVAQGRLIVHLREQLAIGIQLEQALHRRQFATRARRDERERARPGHGHAARRERADEGVEHLRRRADRRGRGEGTLAIGTADKRHQSGRHRARRRGRPALCGGAAVGPLHECQARRLRRAGEELRDLEHGRGGGGRIGGGGGRRHGEEEGAATLRVECLRVGAGVEQHAHAVDVRCLGREHERGRRALVGRARTARRASRAPLGGFAQDGAEGARVAGGGCVHRRAPSVNVDGAEMLVVVPQQLGGQQRVDGCRERCRERRAMGRSIEGVDGRAVPFNEEARAACQVGPFPHRAARWAPGSLAYHPV